MSCLGYSNHLKLCVSRDITMRHLRAHSSVYVPSVACMFASTNWFFAWTDASSHFKKKIHIETYEKILFSKVNFMVNGTCFKWLNPRSLKGIAEIHSTSRSCSVVWELTDNTFVLKPYWPNCQNLRFYSLEKPAYIVRLWLSMKNVNGQHVSYTFIKFSWNRHRGLCTKIIYINNIVHTEHLLSL